MLYDFFGCLNRVFGAQVGHTLVSDDYIYGVYRVVHMGHHRHYGAYAVVFLD